MRCGSCGGRVRDSTNELRLAIKLKSRRGEPAAASGVSLSMAAKEEKKKEPEEAKAA